MKNSARTWAGVALCAALLPGAARAVEVLDNSTISLDLGGSFEQLGELENTTNNSDAPKYWSGSTATTPEDLRDNTRVYLFQTEDRLLLSGTLEGVGFHVEEALGGESISTSNNEMNLYQMYADVPAPLLPQLQNLSVVVGQFKVPSNLASAEDVRSLLFTESSPVFGNFFNLGYDNGVGLKDRGDGWDATVGTISGSPDLPQRYLPEIFDLPPMLYTRFGVGNIADDPYQQVQAVSRLKQDQWGLHFNGEYIRDSNAGHSDDLALQNTDATTVSSDNVFGNALLWSNWNPFLGKTANGAGTYPVDESYWNASVDTQFRHVLDKDTAFIATAQWDFAEFTNQAMDGALYGAATDYLNQATVNLQGGEFVAGVTSDKWSLAGRLDVVLPSNYLIYNNTTVTGVGPTAASDKNITNTDNQITGDKPICELTFPSLTYRVNKYAKLTAETLFWFDSPEVSGDDGVYELMEMPSQVTDLFQGNGTHHNPFVCAGRMAFTLAL